MDRTTRECMTTWSQLEDAEEPERNLSVPQQEKKPDTTEGKVIVDYNLDIDYEGS